jgi:hypothetical protein
MKPVAPATGLDRRTLLSILPALGMVAGSIIAALLIGKGIAAWVAGRVPSATRVTSD